jgi:capsular exopolysaccharide synthesis family protein
MEGSTMGETAVGRSYDREAIRYYLRLLGRRRSAIAACVVVGLGLGLGLAAVQTPVYQASTLVRIDVPSPLTMSVSDALAAAPSYWQYQDFYATEFRVVASSTLGDKVIRKLKLEGRPPFKGATEPGRIFMAYVKVEPVPETRLLRIYVSHTDPGEAALWANTLAQVYLEESVAQRVESARQAYEWLQERLASTQQSMRDAQEKLLASYQEQDVLIPEAGGVSPLTATITKLNSDIAQAQARRIELEAVLTAADEMRQRRQPLDALPQVIGDGVVVSVNSQLAERTAEMRRLREKFTSEHPEVRRVQSQIDDLTAGRAARAEQILLGIASEAAQSKARERELRAALEAQKAQAAAQTRNASRTEALRKEADSSKELYEVLLKKLNETNIATSLKGSNVTIVERAVAPTGPLYPDKRRFAFGGLGLGLLIALVLVVGLDLWYDTVKTADELEYQLQLDLLAAVPRYNGLGDPAVTEAYQNIRTALLFNRPEEGGQVVLVTGATPQEGKTSTTVGLGHLLAAAGESTVLVDCDLRRGQLHARLTLEREPGLTDVLAHQQELAAAIRPVGPPNLWALTTGPVPPNAPALLARKQMVGLLQELRTRFEWVIVDTPPLAAVTDAQLLARHADACLLVVRYDRVSKAMVRRTVQSLRKSGANVLGVVLNAVETRSRGYHHYRYDIDYYHEPETKAVVNGTVARWVGLFRGSAHDREAGGQVEPEGHASTKG